MTPRRLRGAGDSECEADDAEFSPRLDCARALAAAEASEAVFDTGGAEVLEDAGGGRLGVTAGAAAVRPPSAKAKTIRGRKEESQHSAVATQQRTKNASTTCSGTPLGFAK